MNKDQIKGLANQATGEIKQKVGKLTDDKSLRAKGHLGEAKGKAQETLGDAKEVLHDEKEIQHERKERAIELNRGNENLDRMGRR
jgi:uncharacterized protein YjbJ (UPF0337 family)